MKKKKVKESFIIRLISDNGQEKSFRISDNHSWRDVWDWWVINGFKDNNEVIIKYFTLCTIQ